MPYRFHRKTLLPLLCMGVAVIMIGCSPHNAPVQHPNGLSCQTHNGSAETDCSLKCPDGRLLSLPEAMASQTKDELNFEFCGVPLPEPAGASNGQSSGQVQSLPTAPSPLLNQQVDICDPVKGMINFVLAQPPQDLTGKKLVVQIQGQETPCSVSPAFPGELSCKLPPNTNFPAGIVVRVNDQPVNLFPYGGANCEDKPGLHDASEQFPASVPPPQPPPGPGPHHDPPPHPPHPPHGHKPHDGKGGLHGLLLLLDI